MLKTSVIRSANCTCQTQPPDTACTGENVLHSLAGCGGITVPQ